MSEQQRCGLCRYWCQYNPAIDKGECIAPFDVPDSVLEPTERFQMHSISGGRCPCFERKNASDAR